MKSPPGRCGVAALLFVLTVALLALFGFLRPARAEPKKKAPADEKPAAAASATATSQGQSGGKKTKTYTFTGLDIDGKLKTPQLLYFLNRMRSEFDSTTPDKRSFLPELKRSTDEM